MSNAYNNNEIDKIIDSEQFEFPLNIAMASAWVMGNLKGTNLKIYDVSNRTSLADYFILGSMSNAVQAKAAAEEISLQLKRLGYPSKSIEGKDGADWILLDHGDVIVHIFVDISRDNYALDELWSDCKQVEIPQEYYFSGTNDSDSSDSGENYF
ncbi:MAG: ribosome silencing factor [Bdellovibrionales bacterium]|nr:ribosome silencing factor [Bdellovibrionales bacterium]